MKNEGKIFEADFQKSCPENIWIKREKDNVMFNPNQTSNFQRFTMTSDYDYELFNGKTLYLLELKSTLGFSLAFSKFKKTDKYDQLEKLKKLSDYDNVIGEVIINFRDYVRTYFIEINKFIQFKSRVTKKSISVDDCVEIGELIRQEIKRTHYKYSYGLFEDVYPSHIEYIVT